MRIDAFLALAVSIKCFVTIGFAARVSRNGDIAASFPDAIILRDPFFRLTQSLECLPILTTQRFSEPSSEAVVTRLGAVDAPLTPRTSTGTLDLAGSALIACSLVLGLGNPEIGFGCGSEHFVGPASDIERAAALSRRQEGGREGSFAFSLIMKTELVSLIRHTLY